MKLRYTLYVVFVYKIHRVDQMQHHHFSRVDPVGMDQVGINRFISPLHPKSIMKSLTDLKLKKKYMLDLSPSYTQNL